MKNIKSLTYIFLLLTFFFQACKSTKYVPDGKYLLDDVGIKSNIKGLDYFDLDPYVKQNPNYKTFAIYKLPLHLYSLSGRDSSKFYNRWLKKIGEPPVLYDTTFTSVSKDELRRVVANKGYINAYVEAEVTQKDKKVKVNYIIHPKKPYIVTSYKIDLTDSVFQDLSLSKIKDIKGNASKIDSSLLMKKTLVKTGMLFDLSVLDEERDRVATIFRNNGFYSFNKEYVGFVADTLAGNNTVKLEMVFYPFAQQSASGQILTSSHKKYYIRDIKIYTDYDPLRDGNVLSYHTNDSLNYQHCQIFWGEYGHYIKPHVLTESIFFRPGTEYNDRLLNGTYTALSRLDILSNVNIRFYPLTKGDTTKLDCIITCFPEKRQGFSTEIEGTNTTGLSGSAALGAAASVSYRHRNIFKGSELFAIKLQGSFDALSSNSFSMQNNYYEIGAETSLTFPRFLVPFLSHDFKSKTRASTQFTCSYTYQQYPEYYKRTILSAGVKYIWQDHRNPLSKQTLNLIDLSYVHFPYLSESFYEDLPQYTRIYSFQDQFIAGIGYSINNTNYNPMVKTMKPIHSFQAAFETAGNTLNLATQLLGIDADSVGMKKVFGTYYAQYAKINLDYSRTIRLDSKNSYAWHLGGGIAIPYGNSETIPIQKRFFSGGSMSVRGWNVRELGPGSYYDKDGTFYNHSGDIRFDANVEYRSKVFWKFELAAFMDAGNIWTIKDYEDQEGGTFKFDSFYKQIAVAWGLGLRLDFDFLLLRLDCGWKAYDPADRPDHTKWQIIHPFDIGHNTAWHIAIGYPF